MMKNCNKKLAVFFAAAFGLPVILGIFMGVAFYGGKDVSAFPLTWMCLPASGVMLGSLLCRDKESEKAPLPKAFYITFLVMTALLVLICVAGSFAPINTMLVTNQVVILGSLVCLIELAVLKRERRREWGLSLTVNWKKALAGVGAFIVLYLGLTGLSVLASWAMGEDISSYQLNPMLWMWVTMILPLNFVLSFTIFLGEEYGWRYYLQPVLQEKLGLRRGVIVLGLLWGIWHLPINLFYYSPETSLQSILGQLAVCVSFGVFFGWVYMRTKNIWAVTLIHFLNNNLGMALFQVSAEGVEWTWGGLFLSAAMYLGIFLPFLLTKEYRGEGKA